MSVFTPAEIAYLQSQRIGRIATVGPDGQPHVVPVGFRYNPEHDSIDIGGMAGFTKRKHYRDIVRNPKVAYMAYIPEVLSARNDLLHLSSTLVI